MGKPEGAAGFLEADIQRRGLNAAFHRHTAALRKPANHGQSRRLEKGSAIHLPDSFAVASGFSRTS